MLPDIDWQDVAVFNYLITSVACIILSLMFIRVSNVAEHERKLVGDNDEALKRAVFKGKIIGVFFLIISITKLIIAISAIAAIPWVALLMLSVQPDLLFTMLLYWWLADEGIVRMRKGNK